MEPVGIQFFCARRMHWLFGVCKSVPLGFHLTFGLSRQRKTLELTFSYVSPRD
jgi:hypothetical protein